MPFPLVLVPAPRVVSEPYKFFALTAYRGEAGLTADVQVINGTVRWANTVTLSNAADRQANAASIASSSGCTAAIASGALLELGALVEAQLRTQTVVPDWQPPIPLMTVEALPAFPLHCLPTWLADYVAAVAEFTQTPPDLAGMLGLAVLALACQRFAMLELRPGYIEPLCLYVLVAMESGERKSAVYRAMAAPVFAYEADLAERWTGEIARRAAERKILEQSLHKAIGEAANKDATDYDKDAAVRVAQELATTTVPALPALVIQDSTPESMIMELAEQGGTLAALDAEGGLLDTLTGSRYSDNGPNLDPLLKAHAGDEIRAARVSRGKISIKMPMLTIGIAPQPDVLSGMADKPGAKKRGLLARFLYAVPVSRKGRRRQEGAAIPAAVSTAYHQHITALLAAGEPAEPGQGRDRAMLHPSREAYKEWIDLSTWLEPQLARDATLAGTNGWTEKLAGHVARLAASTHLGDGDPEQQAQIPVSSNAMHRAIEMGRDYLLPHALAALRSMGADPAMEDARVILAWIERNGRETFTLRDVYADLRHRFARPDAVKPGLAALVAIQTIREVEEVRKGPGRKPSPRYAVNPDAPTQNTQNTRNSDSTLVQASDEQYTQFAQNTQNSDGVPDDAEFWGAPQDEG